MLLAPPPGRRGRAQKPITVHIPMGLAYKKEGLTADSSQWLPPAAATVITDRLDFDSPTDSGTTSFASVSELLRDCAEGRSVPPTRALWVAKLWGAISALGKRGGTKLHCLALYARERVLLIAGFP